MALSAGPDFPARAHTTMMFIDASVMPVADPIKAAPIAAYTYVDARAMNSTPTENATTPIRSTTWPPHRVTQRPPMSAPKKLLAAITANKIPTTPALTPN